LREGERYLTDFKTPEASGAGECSTNTFMKSSEVPPASRSERRVTFDNSRHNKNPCSNDMPCRSLAIFAVVETLGNGATNLNLIGNCISSDMGGRENKKKTEEVHRR